MAEVKLKDIGERIGVSTVTVSNALSGKKGVSAELREHIETVAAEMGYDLTRYQRRAPGARIGVISTDKRYLEIGNSFYWTMYQQVVAAAAARQSVTMLEPIEEDRQQTEETPRILREKAVDGIIIIGWLFEPYIRHLVKKAGVPVVLLDFRIRGSGCDTVMSCNYTGMYKMTRYLIERGHRKIAFVGSTLATENIMDRYFGYRKALIEAGIPLRKGWVLEDRDLLTGDMQFTLPDEMPTAFACNCDLAASYVFAALEKKGLRVPEDVSVVGYDDYLLDLDVAARLTTYHGDMKRMAEMAVDRLMGKIYGEETHYGTRYIDGPIVERSSVRRLQ